MTTHGCGHCGRTYETWEELSEHLDECDDEICTLCGERFDGVVEAMRHDCPERTGPIRDPEAEWREERRRKKRQQRMERRRRRERQGRLY